MKTKFPATPHDAIFKTFLRHGETARDFLEAHLPPFLRPHCNLDTLKLEPESFLDEKLRSRYSDVLYSLQTGNGASYIYVIIEHQSSPDDHMAFRLMRYAIAAMQRHLDIGHKTIPLVIPILFYHGVESPYPHSMDWIDEFDDPDLARQVFYNAFPLVDITVTPDEDIMQHRRMALLELLQKHIRQRDLSGLLEQLVTLLLLGYTTETQLKALVSYMFVEGNTENCSALLKKLAQRAPKHRETLMTIAEQLHQKGREEGLSEGQRIAAQRIAQTLLKEGLDREKVSAITGVAVEELQQQAH
ncbi:Rpn family recombination-promoting nuclease/putative transposase [Pseudocitrobacter faecalis]|uniref:Rpn family recombination-promoting nuclease/putative transposase n=1 Tax=Pseudocitrobacter faecalis TaxID=1398493 RepID=UPI0039EEC4B6